MSLFNGSSVRKHGVILTCFVDGRKRFRAIRAEAAPADASGLLPIKGDPRRRETQG